MNELDNCANTNMHGHIYFWSIFIRGVAADVSYQKRREKGHAHALMRSNYLPTAQKSSVDDPQ